MRLPLPQLKECRVLADQVTGRLREAILDGHFESGEKLDQDQIAEELGVSLTPVREALRRLESEGFIEIRPHCGAFIPVISSQYIREIYQLRRLLEPEVVKLATTSVSESVLDQLERRLTEIQSQFDSGDFSDQFASSIFFHNTILASVDNSLLKEVLSSLSNRIRMVWCFAQREPGPHMTEALREHRAILKAMRRHDAEEAAELMRLHLEKSVGRIQQLLK